MHDDDYVHPDSKNTYYVGGETNGLSKREKRILRVQTIAQKQEYMDRLKEHFSTTKADRRIIKQMLKPYLKMQRDY